MSIATVETATVRCDFCGESKALPASSVGHPERDERSGRMICSGLMLSHKSEAVAAGYRAWSLETWDPREYGSRGGHACSECFKKLNRFINELGAK